MERATTFAFSHDASANEMGGSGMFTRESSMYPPSFMVSDKPAQQQREVHLHTNRFLPTGGSGVVHARSGGGALAQRTSSSTANLEGSNRRFGHTGGFQATTTANLPFGNVLGAFKSTTTTIDNNGPSFGPTTSSSSGHVSSPLIDSSLLQWVGSTGRLSHAATVTRVVKMSSGRHCIIVAGDQHITVLDENVLRITTNNVNHCYGQDMYSSVTNVAKGQPISILGGCGMTMVLPLIGAGAITSIDCKVLPTSTKGEIVCVVGTSAATIVPFVIIPSAGAPNNNNNDSEGSSGNNGMPFVISVQPAHSISTATSNTVCSTDKITSVVVGLDLVTSLPTFIAAASQYAVVMFNCQLPLAAIQPQNASSSLRVSFDGFQLFKGRRIVRMVDVVGSAGSSLQTPSDFQQPTSPMRRTDVVHNTTVLSPSATVVLAVLLSNSEVHFIAKELPRVVDGCKAYTGRNARSQSVAGAVSRERSSCAAYGGGVFSLSPEPMPSTSGARGHGAIPTSTTTTTATFGAARNSQQLRSISMTPRAEDFTAAGMRMGGGRGAAECDDEDDGEYAPNGAIASLGGIDINLTGKLSSSALNHGDSTLPEFYAVAEFLTLKDLADKYQLGAKGRFSRSQSEVHGGQSAAAAADPISAILEKPSLAPLLAFNDLKCFYNHISNSIDIVAVGQSNSYSKRSSHANYFSTNNVSGFICTVRSALRPVTSLESGALVIIMEEHDNIKSVVSGVVGVVGSQSSTERGLGSVCIISSVLPPSTFKYANPAANGLNRTSMIPLSASLITCGNELFISSLSCPSSDDHNNNNNNTSVMSNNSNNNNVNTSSTGGSGSGAAPAALKKGLKLLHSFGGSIQFVEVLGVHLLPLYNSGTSTTNNTWFCDVIVGQGNTAQVYRLPLA